MVRTAEKQGPLMSPGRTTVSDIREYTIGVATRRQPLSS